MSYAALAEAVTQRAHDRCEYCLMHQQLQGATFHIEHVVPSSRGGLTELSNLALACPGCNLRKSDRVEAVDPDSIAVVGIFHPRQQHWSEHFAWSHYRILGLTATGRATIAALQLNHERRLRVRQAEELFGLFPPG